MRLLVSVDVIPRGKKKKSPDIIGVSSRHLLPFRNFQLWTPFFAKMISGVSPVID